MPTTTKFTEYYQSGRQIANARNAAIKATEKVRELKEARIEKYLSDPSRCKLCNTSLSYVQRKNMFCGKNCAAKFNNQLRPAGHESRVKQTKSLLETHEELRGSTIKPKKSPVQKPLKKFCEIHIITCAVCKKLHTIPVRGKRSKNRKICKDPACIQFYRSSGKTCKILFHKCQVCNKDFVTANYRNDKKTCGNRTCKTHLSVGVRNYQNGRKKLTQYFNIHQNQIVLLESSWELYIAKLLDSLSIKWIRPSYIQWIDALGKTRLYYPDFYLPDYLIYLDPKNPYGMLKDEFKMSQISKKVNILWGDISMLEEKILNLSSI